MLETSTLGKFWILGVLSTVWLMISHVALRLDSNKSFHLATFERDKRKAKFYFFSMWTGLGAAGLSFLGQEALYGTAFDSSLTRDWVFHVLRGVGLWGLMIIGLVWSQVGQRVSQLNSDGKSLTPYEEQEQRGRDTNVPSDHRRK
jgi:hypothetical protein